MTYSFGAPDVKRIEGKEFILPATSKGEKFVGHVARRAPGVSWPRTGSEAVCLLAEVKAHRKLKSVLKVFRYALPERARRQAMLVRSGFARDYDWLFQCVPYSSFYDKFAIAGVPVIGHLSKYIGAEYGSSAEDFDRLKQGEAYSSFSFEQRRRFVGHLATAVAVLEAKGFAHGDLSDGNLLIGPGPQDGGQVLVLCDFDGFHHNAAPKLPRKKRPLGTDGYIPLFLADRIEADTQKADDSICVTSDRFALAVLACELMAWNGRFTGPLAGRYRLFTTEALREMKSGDWAVPAEIVATWPAGFQLLSRALHATDWSELPSPHEWLRVVGVDPSVEGIPFVNPPFLRIRRAAQTADPAWRRVRVKSAAGHLAKVDPALAKIGFQYQSNRLMISVPAGETLLAGGIGRAKKQLIGPIELKVSPETELVAAGHVIQVYDSEFAPAHD